ncbi:MAG: thiamine diphosphokinase, partial [Eubacteriales bacterium]
MRRCVIITGFITGNPKKLFRIKKNDFIICADKGYSYAKSAKIKPNMLIGDFDSLNIDMPDDISIEHYPSEKNDTDTMLCLKYALERDFDEIILIGGIGGRIDHTIANIQAMAYTLDNWKGNDRYQKRISMIDDKNWLILIKNNAISLTGREGQLLSIASFSNESKKVTTSGLHWNLREATLTNTFPLGVSNYFEDRKVNISVGDG